MNNHKANIIKKQLKAANLDPEMFDYEHENAKELAKKADILAPSLHKQYQQARISHIACFINKGGVIPKQLQNPEFRFVLIKPKSKIPYEKDWQNTANYKFNDQKLLQHNGNYGVLCGKGGLIVIDADNQDVAAKVLAKLPRSFQVKTGKGIHFYFICKELEKKIVLADTSEGHYGEVQAAGTQVIGAGSIHPSGKEYKVLEDAPIAEISKEQLLEVLKPFMKKEASSSMPSSLKPTLRDEVCEQIKANVSLQELMQKQGYDLTKHPTKCLLGHDMQGEGNFSYDFNKGLWNCFHCGKGGDIFNFVMEHEGCDFVNAKKKLAIKTGFELKDKRIIVFVEDTIRVVGIRYEEKPIGVKGGMKKVPYETEKELKVKLTSRICEFYCEGELINRFAYKGKIKDTQISNLAKVLVDIKSFDVTKEARQWIVEEKIFERLSNLKDKLDQKNKEEYQTKVKKLEEEKDIQKQVLMFLSMGQEKRKEATETLSKAFLENEIVYSIRDDTYSEMWIYKEGIFIPQAKTYVKEFCREVLQQAYTPHLCNEVVAKIEADTYIEQEELFRLRDINFIAVENGVLNIRTKELKPNSPEYFFFNKIPVRFDPSKKCETIIQHLKNVLGNEKDYLVMQEIFGYLLYKNYQIEKAFMFTGYGRNGKGKTIELMKRFLGVENCANIPLQQFDKDVYAMGELFNKMANLAADISSNELRQTGNFKNLTGHDLVSAARKYKTRVNFVNYAKMIFCANELPRTTDLTMAFFNRWVLIDFPFTFISKKEYDALSNDQKQDCKIADTKIIEKLSCPDQLSGLLNWSIEGLNRVLTNGDFSSSKTTEEVKKDWIRKSDSLTSFVNEEMIETPEGYVSKGDFRQRYKQYCKEHKLKPFSEIKIKKILLEELGVWDARKKVTIDVDENIKEEEVKPCWIGIEFMPK